MSLSSPFIPAYFTSLTKREKEKLGNVLNLITTHSKGIFLTRLLKLVYLIDERSVLEIGVPVTTLEYSVAKNGPLAVDLWKDLSTYNCFGEYIRVESYQDERYDGLYIKTSNEKINKAIFSEYELELIQNVVSENEKQKTAEIIKELHEKEGSLWKHIVEKNKINFSSENGWITNHKIDFFELIKDDDLKEHFYTSFNSIRNV